ncbi:hypothetical protein BRADI_5g03933v3, partial [Brachypodium distachyon]
GFQSLCAGVLESVIVVLVPSTPSIYRAPLGVVDIARSSAHLCSFLAIPCRRPCSFSSALLGLSSLLAGARGSRLRLGFRSASAVALGAF